ncbi:DUF4145 domain-containing protein [Yersinia enterocolitica]|uniref:DUF4145 domain-containing protein n=1 Tax=Yersinia enterocolitica TaxID=630 RepID=UPI0005E68A02|nr:DUF4145 domain-containing protein [Yersinia enterocolitica]CRY60412.1 Uncharacterised protein [Yersinia kristensenii]EKN3383999.1 DUF4145 domain-containing protein [Yersinia enterocolitica]EKN3585652.1 DUF4145 domain-containing protein [Yersinia enterocolitica]EKN3589114.1 DUF4145 domain-containing protein [Yersinia enterocolitica]EKN3765951.1 DUF4145 domain-containing protein [Yersinia enterocolitica]
MIGPFKFGLFTKNSIPDWRCPACARPTLELVPDSFKMHRTARAHHQNDRDEGFCPDDDEDIFSCLLLCNRTNCLQPVAVSGDGYYDREYVGPSSYDYEYFSVLRPRHFYPPLTLFTPCDSYPERIKTQLLELSAQLPGHPQAAINALRTTLEMVLDDFNIPREKHGRYLSLDKRISLIPTTHQYVEAGFRAMKWLGNTGSHNLREVSEEDIEGACIMLDDFLLRIYRPPTDHSVTIARLNENHDPRVREKAKE